MLCSGCQKRRQNRRHKSISVLITGIWWLTTIGMRRYAILRVACVVFLFVLICLHPLNAHSHFIEYPRKLSQLLVDILISYAKLWAVEKNIPLCPRKDSNLSQHPSRENFHNAVTKLFVHSVDKSRVCAAATSQVSTH